MILDLNFIAIAGVLIAATSLFMATLMFSLGHVRLNHIWGLFCLAVFVWGISFYFIGTTQVPETARLWWKISHLGVIFIPVLFMHFVYSFLGLKTRWLLWAVNLLGLFFLYADVATNWLIDDMRYVFGIYYDSPPGVVYLPFFLFFQGFILYGHYLLLRAYLKSKEHNIRQQIRYFFMATFVGFLGGGISFSPVFGLDIYPYTIITVALYPVIMGYAILKYKLFNMKVVTAQIIALTIFGFTFVQLFRSESTVEYVLNAGVLFVTLVLGVYLIRSVMREVEQRERIQELAKHLRDANVRLKELDRQKSEFLSMAAHQLRTPLTSIKGYASLMLEGSYGNLPDKVDGVLETIFASSSRMVDTVSDFLNVSRIEQGKMDYRLEKTDLGSLAKSVVTELALSAKEKKLDLNYHEDDYGSYPIYADVSKIEHVISNLVDNAIKYTPKGAVSVRVERDELRNVGVVKVIDTGSGIPAEALPKLFDKFVRARNAHEINVTGTGLGLYVAREMMNKHGGKIWAESKGVGKGSTFVVEIPLTMDSD
jgi:signal transduction histidine kinase